MLTSSKVIDAIVDQGLLPLYFHANEEVSCELLLCLYRAGIRVVEYTVRGPSALLNFRKMVALRDKELPGLLLGAGTIKNRTQADNYIQAGADFLISPGFIPEVAACCVDKGILYIPGCMTPSEIISAENAGLKMIKLFPGNILGPAFMASIKDVFPELLFMPTGGVDPTKESMEKWFASGVCAVGMGSKLISKEFMESKDYVSIENLTRHLLELIKTLRK
jgi:2-dehydro-3-deoxyphosphogluconate aldolase/(4S)-4-hydroxy-2-oxoglutarate aldolase